MMKVQFRLSYSAGKTLNLPKTILAFSAKSRIRVDDDEYESDIKKGEVFYLGIRGNTYFLLDMDGIDFHRFNITEELFTKIGRKHELLKKQNPEVLKFAYKMFNAIWFGNDMKLPKFTTASKADRNLEGFWDERKRQIYVDTDRPGWIEVLLHEMCHQYVDEHTKVKEPIHGKTFQKHAKRVGAKVANLDEENRDLKQQLSAAKRAKLVTKDADWVKNKAPDTLATIINGKLVLCYVIAINQDDEAYCAFEGNHKGKIQMASVHRSAMLKTTKAEEKELLRTYGKQHDVLKQRLMRALGI